MNALEFFINKADSIQVNCWGSDSIGIDICMERDNYGRTIRAIAIYKDKGLVELSCYEDWGGDGQGTASIFDDELRALIEFIPTFMSGQDKISQSVSLLSKTEADSFRMIISASAIKVIWNRGTYDDQCSCSLSMEQKQHFEGDAPEELEKEVQRVWHIIWDQMK